MAFTSGAHCSLKDIRRRFNDDIAWSIVCWDPFPKLIAFSIIGESKFIVLKEFDTWSRLELPDVEHFFVNVIEVIGLCVNLLLFRFDLWCLEFLQERLLIPLGFLLRIIDQFFGISINFFSILLVIALEPHSLYLFPSLLSPLLHLLLLNLRF